MTTSRWKPISSAPKDGSRFVGRKKWIAGFTDKPPMGTLCYTKRITWHGKTSHVPLYGWCHGRVEDTDLWEPTEWTEIETDSALSSRKPKPGTPA